MKATGITNQGLTVIGLLVLLLWGMIFAERALVSKARQVYEEIQRSRPLAQPAPQRPIPAQELPIQQQPLDTLTVT